jgi:hypothetical protein
MTNPFKIGDRVQVSPEAQHAVTDVDNEHLTRIRERATEVAAPTPEQERLANLEQRLTVAETEHQRFVDAIAAELVTLEQRIERAGLEERLPRPSEPDPRADIDAAQAWCELLRDSRTYALTAVAANTDAGAMAADALEAVPDLLRRIEQHEQGPRRSRVQAWQALERACREQMPAEVIGALQVLDELPDDEPPPDSAPPLSEAEAETLRHEVARLRARIDLLTSERDHARRRSGQALETLREVFDLRPGCDLITDAADDACEYPRELLRVLGYDGVDGPLPQQCLRDVRQLSSHVHQIQLRLAEIMGEGPIDQTAMDRLNWIEPRVGVIRDLCETIPVEALRGVAAGLTSFGGEDHCPAVMLSAALFDLANLEDPPDDAEPDSEPPRKRELELLRRLHCAADEQMGIRACASLEDALADLLDAGYPPDPGLAQPVQDEPS